MAPTALCIEFPRQFHISFPCLTHQSPWQRRRIQRARPPRRWPRRPGRLERCQPRRKATAPQSCSGRPGAALVSWPPPLCRPQLASGARSAKSWNVVAGLCGPVARCQANAVDGIIWLQKDIDIGR
eukprot:scaffold434_cov186-Pinguiococcus_pyrenoidosus.AAC.54